MYEAFFNLRRKPFELLPNPEFLFHSRSHKKVLAYLNYGIRERSGFILLTGEVGTGKTTLIRELVQKHMRDVLLARVFHTKVESFQLLAMINADLGLNTADKDKPTLLHDLHEFLITQYARRRPVVLIIDEAQNLTMDVLEEVRMLSNLETEDNKLLHIILVGQPELRRVLSSPELLQLRQRIQINCNIEPIGQNEIESYILHRLEAAGNRQALDFAPGCFEVIHQYTRGIPRLINILCDYILLDAFGNESREATVAGIHEIAQDLSFNAQYWESTPLDQPQEAPKPVAKAHLKHQGNRLYSVLLHLNRRLQHLEAAQSRQSQAISDELRSTLNAMNERMEALCRAMGERSVPAAAETTGDPDHEIQAPAAEAVGTPEDPALSADAAATLVVAAPAGAPEEPEPDAQARSGQEQPQASLVQADPGTTQAQAPSADAASGEPQAHAAMEDVRPDTTDPMLPVEALPEETPGKPLWQALPPVTTPLISARDAGSALREAALPAGDDQPERRSADIRGENPFALETPPPSYTKTKSSPWLKWLLCSMQ